MDDSTAVGEEGTSVGRGGAWGEVMGWGGLQIPQALDGGGGGMGRCIYQTHQLRRERRSFLPAEAHLRFGKRASQAALPLDIRRKCLLAPSLPGSVQNDIMQEDLCTLVKEEDSCRGSMCRAGSVRSKIRAE